MYRACFQHLYDIERKRIAPTPVDHLRLHRLERPEEWPQWPGVNFYPHYPRFYDRVSQFIGVDAAHIVAGAGIEDLIRSLVFLCCDPGDKIAFTFPTCAMFGLYADMFGAKRVKIITDPDNPPRVEDICSAIVPGVRLLILPNPGQPVDTCYNLEGLRAIARHCRKSDTVFAIDEAYHGFGAVTALPLIAEFDNVLVLRTFSKAFGGAALRVGYAVGSYKAVQPLEATRSSGEIAGPSLEIAIEMMDRFEEIIAPGIQAVIEGRAWLMRQLAGQHIKARGWNSNHVLIDLGNPVKANSVWSMMSDKCVHVKGNYEAPLDRHLLITCGSVPMMQKFYECFSHAYG